MLLCNFLVFGGAVLARVILEGGSDWSDSFFWHKQLIQFGVTDSLPAGFEAIHIHGTEDEVVSFEGSAI